MTDSTKIHQTLPVSGSTITAHEHDDQIKGAASAVSLAEIEQLFEILENGQNSKEKKDVSESEKELLDLISSLLQGIEGGKVDGKTTATIQGYISDFNKGDATALGKLLAVVMPAVQGYAQKHPEDLMGVIKALAPFMKDAGANVMAKANEANKCFEMFRVSYAKSKDPKKEEKLAELL